LRPFRDRVFLSCKTTCRDREGAWRELNESLARLETDFFDFYQLHGFRDPEKDAGRACAQDGALAAALEGQRQGLVKHIGFSAHTVESARVALGGYDFDVMMFPVNFFSFASGYEDGIGDAARERDIGLVALKALAKGRRQDGSSAKEFPNCWYEPLVDPRLAGIAISWTLGRNPALFIPPADARLFRLALSLAADAALRAPTREELELLRNAGRESVPVFGPQFC